MKNSFKTLIEVNRDTWGQVKKLTTIRNITLSQALNFLLKNALAEDRYGEKEWTGR